MFTLLIDDVRELSVTRTARTFAAGIAALQERQWDVLYLDHDLADFSGPDGRELTGYDVVCWLEANPQHLPGKVEIVSSNPVGRQRMASVLGKFYSEWRFRR
jgi:hypothetical protein